MQRIFIFFFLSILLTILIFNLSFCQDDLKIWNEFVSTLKKGNFPSEKVRPNYESLREPVLGYLKNIHQQTIWQDRAEKAGWTLKIEYKGDECVFYFKKMQLDYWINKTWILSVDYWSQIDKVGNIGDVE